MSRIGRHSWRATILAIQFLTAAAPLAVVPFLSLHFQRLAVGSTADASYWTAVAAAAPAVTAVISTPLWGGFARGQPISLAVFLTCALTAASYLVMAAADDPAMFTLGRALQGSAGSGIILLLAVDHLKARPEREYIGLQQAFSAGCLAGPIIGGWAFDHQCLDVILSTTAAALLVLAAAFALVARPTRPGLRRDHHAQAGFFHPTFAHVRRNGALVIAASLGTAGAFGFVPFFAEWAKERDAASFTASAIGTLHAASWFAAIIVLPIWGRVIDGVAAARSIALSLLGSAAAYAAMSVSATVPWISMLRVTQGVFYSGLTPALYAGVGRSGERRQELAVARTALTMGQILGPALCGAVLPFAGTDGALLIAAGLPAIGLLILISARGDRS